MTLDLRTLSYNVDNLTPDAALELLRDFWIAARERRSDFKHILVITGPPGSGKSVLTRELNRLITGRDWPIGNPYNSMSLAESANKHRFVSIDNWAPLRNMTSRERLVLDTAVKLASPDSEYISPKGKHIDTSNTYLVINCIEVPKWIDTNTMLHLHLFPWRRS